MILHIADHRGVFSSRAFTHSVAYRSGLLLRGAPACFLDGEYLHMLLPLLAADAVPRDLLKPGPAACLPMTFWGPHEVRIKDVVPGGPPNPYLLKGLGHALCFPIPNGPIGGFFLVEGMEFAALHPQDDFRFLGETSWSREWHLVFTSQAYRVLFGSDQERDTFAAEVRKNFPDPQDPAKVGPINIFSAYDEPTGFLRPGKTLPRFKAADIREMPDDQIDPSHPVIVSPRFSPSSTATRKIDRTSFGFGNER